MRSRNMRLIDSRSSAGSRLILCRGKREMAARSPGTGGRKGRGSRVEAAAKVELSGSRVEGSEPLPESERESHEGKEFKSRRRSSNRARVKGRRRKNSRA